MPFDPNKQKIYEYYDGTLDDEGNYRIRRGDPIVIYRNMVNAVGGEAALDEFWKKVHSPGSPTPTEDRAMLVEFARAAFEIKPAGYGPGGVGELGVLEILYDFTAWQKKSEKNGDGSPNISQLTQGSPSRSTNSPTMRTSASG